MLAAGDVAVTARGRATVVADRLEGAGDVAAIAFDVEHVDDHGRATFEILDGVRWRWRDEAARRRDAGVRAALRALC